MGQARGKEVAAPRMSAAEQVAMAVARSEFMTMQKEMEALLGRCSEGLCAD